MMKMAWAKFKRQNRHFWHHGWAYGKVVLTIELIISLICVPGLNRLANWILALGDVNYLSYTNLGELLKQRPLVIIALLVILGLILLLIFGQFTLLLLGFYHIRHRRSVSFWTEIKVTVKQIWHLPIRTFSFFSLYFLIILPFGQVGFTTRLLSKVKIPAFIIDWLFTEHLPLGLLLIGLYLIILYLGLRWLFVLPLVILEQQPVRQAMQKSWRKTRQQTWTYAGYFGLLALAVMLMLGLIYGSLLAVQWGLDQYWPKIAATGAIINLSLIQIISLAANIYGTSLIALLMLSEVEQTVPDFGTGQRRYLKIKQVAWFSGLVMAIVLFMGYSVLYFSGYLLQKPVTISHRGVDHGNGVQNTIPALQKTARERPDYIEMDIQETKDHQFVVLHDENLKHLAGINRAPGTLTLAQLQQLTVRENGYQAKIPSFDAYYRAAKQTNQKLLIEFKRTPAMTDDFVQRFATRYGAQLQRHGDLIHSLDYQLIQQSRQLMPKVSASYILSFNLVGLPRTQANYFTMEYTTLNSTFIDEAHAQHKKVFAWTVNDSSDMDQLLLKNVDGIITDELADLQQEIQANFRPNTYAMRLVNYLLEMPASQFLNFKVNLS